MTQLKYDITEFVIFNRDEILDYLNHESEHLKKSEELFESCPEVYDELVDNHRCTLLADYLSNYFPCAFESICMIVDREFIKVIYTMEVT